MASLSYKAFQGNVVNRTFHTFNEISLEITCILFLLYDFVKCEFDNLIQVWSLNWDLFMANQMIGQKKELIVYRSREALLRGNRQYK